MQTVPIPKPFLAAPFLQVTTGHRIEPVANAKRGHSEQFPFPQHPGLAVGQKRYLCSIASVYSTENMRQQMKRHRLNLLHACLQQGACAKAPAARPNIRGVVFTLSYPTARSEAPLQTEGWAPSVQGSKGPRSGRDKIKATRAEERRKQYS